MARVKLPAQGGAVPYRFQTDLEAVLYTFQFRWNARDNHWYMDVYQTGTAILVGIKVTNSDDLLSQFGHMQVDGRLPPGTFEVFDTDEALRRDPDQTTFGDTVVLLYNEAA